MAVMTFSGGKGVKMGMTDIVRIKKGRKGRKGQKGEGRVTKGGVANAQDMGRAYNFWKQRLKKPKRSSWTRPWEEVYKRGCKARLPEACEVFGCFVCSGLSDAGRLLLCH